MDVSNTLKVSRGQPSPLGPTILGSSVNFCLYAPYAQIVRLLIFTYNQSKTLSEQFAEITLDPQKHRTGDAWHVEIGNLPEKILYGYQIDDSPIILDPYSPEIWSGGVWGEPNPITSSQSRLYSPLSLINRSPESHELIPSPKHPLRDLVIYEMHVRGFTQHPSCDVKHPGTYLGVIEALPTIKELGFNAIELLPIQEFFELSRCESYIPTKNMLINYWGYSPVSFFAPMNRYAAKNKPGAAADEFRALVNACHQQKIEVILDVVFNHTDRNHPCRVLDKENFYLLDSERRDANYSGCGNTFNCNHPLSIDLIVSALRHWVSTYGVDGFRFDLASIMTRGTDKTPLSTPPLIKAINADPVLKETKLIAEPWDAAGLYQVGNFPAHEGRWAEWNGQYRDATRRFIKGTEYVKGDFATALCGSETLYHDDRKPYHSINMITCHDGFSLYDLVSYQQKHNEANAENNQDGTNAHESWHCGSEGETDNLEIESLRLKQIKNFIAALMVSQGVPLWKMGDERLHTQWGNNNTWCQDNELSWLDWSQPLLEFLPELIGIRKKFPTLRQAHFLTSQDIEWHDPRWDSDDRLLAFTLKDHDQNQDIFIAFNASHEKRELILPKSPPQTKWQKLVETASEAGVLPPYSAVIYLAQKIHS